MGSLTASAPLLGQHSRLLIVDDHPFFAQGMAQALLDHAIAAQVEMATDVAGALAFLDRQDQTTHPVDLILLDLSLPGEGGLALLRALDDRDLLIPVVVVSSRDDEGAVRAARAAGAMGFLSKTAPIDSVRRLLAQIVRGEPCFARQASNARAQPIFDSPLTPRQHDVLRLVANGLSNKRICQELQLTEDTVKSHLKAIYSTLAVHNRTACALAARELGLVDH